MISEPALRRIEELGKRLLDDLETVNWGKPQSPPPPIDPSIGIPSDLYTQRERDLYEVLTALPKIIAMARCSPWTSQE